VGQKEDFEAIGQKALQTGASKVYVEDLREEFIVNYIYPALRANAVYEQRYLLGIQPYHVLSLPKDKSK